MGPKKLLTLAALMAALGGCAHMGAGPSLMPTCTALIGPIRYNTYVLKSRRHAGPDLARDLKARNQVGQSLGCAQYR